MTSLILAVVLALAGNLATNTVQVLAWWWPPLVWSVVVVLLVVTAVLERRRHHASAGVNTVDVAAQELAVRLRARSFNNPLRVRLNRPMPLTVWFRSETAVGAAWPVVTGEDGPGWDRAPISDHVGRIAEVLRGLPHRQLVVLGEPGAGKSVLTVLLTHELLKSALPDEPLPVLLTVSSWNPDTESVAMFVARQLADDYGVDADTAVRLVTEPGTQVPAGFRMMPVLDGLDEIPVELQAKALNELEMFGAADHPLVVTCRRREFQRAAAAEGVLSRAAVIGIEPVRPDTAIAYLRGAGSPHGRWEPVAAKLKQHPEGRLARLLSTPLMVSLARDTYANPASPPQELVGLAARGQATPHLVSGYVTAVYRNPARTEPSTRGLHVYDPADAARWLGTLALHLYETGSRDLYWWQLPLGLLSVRPRQTRLLWRAGFAAVTAAIVGTALSLWYGWLASLVAACLTGGLVGMVAVGVFGPPLPQWHRAAPPPTPAGRVWRLTLFGLLCGAIVGVIVDAPAAGLLAGPATAFGAAALNIGAARRHLPTTAATLRNNHFRWMALAGRYAVAAALMFGAGAALLGAPVPSWILAAAPVYAAAAALTGGGWTWIEFRLAHARLALHGWPHRHRSLLPPRLITFLRDGAHPSRATLRSNGPAWQFRHAIIQDHLHIPARRDILRRRSAWLKLANLLPKLGELRELHKWRRDTRLARCHEDAWRELAELLRERGDLDDLRRHPFIGGWSARRELVGLLRERGDLHWLRRLADIGDRSARRELAELLRERGDLHKLRRLAGTYNAEAPKQQLDGTRRLADADNEQARELLARLLRERDELRQLAGTGDYYARRELVGLLRERGDLDGAIAALRRHADTTGDSWARRQLVELLQDQSHNDEGMRP